MNKPITHSLFIFAFLFLIDCVSAEPAPIEHGSVAPKGDNIWDDGRRDKDPGGFLTPFPASHKPILDLGEAPRPEGEWVVVEAVGDGYSAYARISAFSGLQTVLGWPGHETQWRGSYEPQGTRREDVTRLYSTSRWEEAQAIIQQYDIRYIYIGVLERLSLPVNEEKFAAHLIPVFQQGGSVIYQVP